MLKVKVPMVKRVNGIRGILEAHQECARQSITDNFYVVDADALIMHNFEFNFEPDPNKMIHQTIPETECIHIWRSENSVNGLIYGYGGVKLFPKDKLLSVTEWFGDMTTSIKTVIIPRLEISNITAFNTDPFNSWKSAFRECVKLSSSIIVESIPNDNIRRLAIWCNEGGDKPNGKYCIYGAIQGADFGEYYKFNQKALHKINNFDWLKEQFDKEETKIRLKGNEITKIIEDTMLEAGEQLIKLNANVRESERKLLDVGDKLIRAEEKLKEAEEKLKEAGAQVNDITRAFNSNNDVSIPDYLNKIDWKLWILMKHFKCDENI